MRIGSESPRYEMVPLEPSRGDAGSMSKSNAAEEASFAQALNSLGHAVDGGEALVAKAAHGNLGGLDSMQLIALQAGIYRYSEAVDLVGKLVDRAATAVKTVVSPH